MSYSLHQIQETMNVYGGILKAPSLDKNRVPAEYCMDKWQFFNSFQVNRG